MLKRISNSVCNKENMVTGLKFKPFNYSSFIQEINSLKDGRLP